MDKQIIEEMSRKDLEQLVEELSAFAEELCECAEETTSDLQIVTETLTQQLEMLEFLVERTLTYEDIIESIENKDTKKLAKEVLSLKEALLLAESLIGFGGVK